MKEILPTIISWDQVGYLKGRYIGQNIRLIKDVIEKCEQDTGIVAFLDFEKAFDSIEWEFLIETLKICNFGESFINWYRILYCDIEACVTNNGYSSPFFKLTRGCRQGCPLSPYLFIIAVEALAWKIKLCNDIRGIDFQGRSVKITQMADDTTVLVKDHESLKMVLDLMDTFKKCSGLRLNKGKTEAMWLGIKGHRKKGLDIKWQNDKIYSLGIWFCRDHEEDIILNVENALEKCCKVLDTWSNRKLSLKGRITVIKTFAMPKLLYVLNNVYTPDRYVKKAHDCFFKYLWEQKPDKVKRDVITQDYSEGGLRMINFQFMFKSLKAMWIKRMMTNTNANWLLYIKSLIDINLSDFIKCNLNPNKIPNSIPKFYKQVFSAWAEIKDQMYDYKSPWEIRRQFIFYNKYITAGQTYYNKHWRSNLYSKNIKCIHDVCNQNGTIMTKNEIATKYDITLNTMEYNSLLNSIPNLWKNILKKQTIPHNAITNTESLHLKVRTMDKQIDKIKNKDLYEILLKNKRVNELKCKTKWEDEFGKGQNWKTVFASAKVDTKFKLQSFHYAIVHRFFPCNLYLSKWKENTTSCCEHCNQNEIDTISHYFVYCQKINSLWTTLETWCNTRIQEPYIKLNCEDIILGTSCPGKYNELINFVILQMKWFIYCKKLNKEEATFREFLHVLDNRLNIEKYILTVNGKQNLFERKFGVILPIFRK